MSGEQELLRRVAVFAGLHVGPEGWRYRSFAAAILDLGILFPAAPWPGRRPQRAPGRCFDAATEYAEATGAIYVEGFAYAPALHQWPVFEHAWCLEPDGAVADPSLPDGHATHYLGIPNTHAFRRAEQTRRQCAPLLADAPHDFRTPPNEQLLEHGLPTEAIALLPVPSRAPGQTEHLGPLASDEGRPQL
ncbi:hypothetical protein [Kitasatospora sp. NPDC088783]|uniref:hypothetical protein n=1 Tax=Kitasatospora sp. NPDC088783 TaxID=3364077 RepID=UPI0038091DC2